MTRHVPVLLEETIDLLAPALAGGGWVVDCTLGLGGHAAAILERFPDIRLLGLDRDDQALALAAERLAPFRERVHTARSRFSEIEARIGALGPEITGSPIHVRALLADLGVSSLQLDDAERGFSFRHDAPLDMRMGTTEAPTAAQVVADYPEEDLTEIFREYGEERHAARVARGIVRAREDKPVETTAELAELVARLKPGTGRHRRPRAGRRPLHPATQVFQALRIEVNRELDELRDLLDQAVRLLEQDGRLSVISYHSLEDRIVKHTLRDLATGEIEPVTGRPLAETQVLEVLTKKPVRPSDTEVAANPRARSARLRAARRL